MIKLDGKNYDVYLGQNKLSKVIYVDGDGIQHSIWSGSPAIEPKLYLGFILKSKIDSGLTESDIVDIPRIHAVNVTGATTETLTCILPAAIPENSWEPESEAWISNNAYAITFIQPLNNTATLKDILDMTVDLNDGGQVTINGTVYKIGYNQGDGVALYADTTETPYDYSINR